MKKRWIAVILTAMTLATLLAGCGGAAEKPSGTLDTPTPTAQPTEAPEETAAPEETPAPDETMLTLGTIQGGRYENETLGIGAEFDSDWLIADREELNALGGLAAEVITDEELRAAMEKADYFYDLYARTEDNTLLVQLVFEKLNAVAAALYDEDKYADVSVLHTPDRWFGLTYREDKPGVVEALQKLHAEGVYPPTLWG